MMFPKEIPPSVMEAIDAGVPAVRAFHEASGESAEVFATNAGFDLVRFAAIEVGQTPTPDEVQTIAAGLGISVDDLNAAFE